MPEPDSTSLSLTPVSTLNELMSRDPLKLTNDDLDEIAKILIAQQASWLAAEKEAKPQGKRANAKAAIDISTLDLKL